MPATALQPFLNWCVLVRVMDNFVKKVDSYLYDDLVNRNLFMPIPHLIDLITCANNSLEQSQITNSYIMDFITRLELQKIDVYIKDPNSPGNRLKYVSIGKLNNINQRYYEFYYEVLPSSESLSSLLDNELYHYFFNVIDLVKLKKLSSEIRILSWIYADRETYKYVFDKIIYECPEVIKYLVEMDKKLINDHIKASNLNLEITEDFTNSDLRKINKCEVQASELNYKPASEPLLDELDPRTQNNIIRLLLALNEMAKDRQGQSLDYGRDYNKESLTAINAKLDLLGYKNIGETAFKTLTTLIRETQAKGL